MTCLRLLRGNDSTECALVVIDTRLLRGSDGTEGALAVINTAVISLC